MSEKGDADRRFQCNFCGRTFRRSEHLRRHTTTHTQEKTFRCFCGKSFGRRDLLKRHEEIGKHLISTQSPLQSSARDSSPAPGSSSQTPSYAQRIASQSGSRIDTAQNAPQSMLDDSSGGDWFQSNAFQNFDAFVSAMGLDASFYHILPNALDNPTSLSADQGPLVARRETLWAHAAPEADPENVHELKRIPNRWTVTQRQRDELDAALDPYRPALSGFVLPSALAIGRYVTGYMEDFQDHQAVIHIPTFALQDSLQYPELILAICACGAGTRYEKQSAIRIFRASKAIIEVQGSRDSGDSPLQTRSWTQPALDNLTARRTLRRAQATMLLSTFAIMEGQHYLIHEAASLHSFLVEYVRDQREAASLNQDSSCWQDWIFEESSRRTQCAIYNILNMHTMVLDSAPVLPSIFLGCNLPCSTPEWTASTESDWLSAKAFSPKSVGFQEAHATLFNALAPNVCVHAPLGNLVLVNAILQRIHHIRQLQLDSEDEALRDVDLKEIEIALDRWTHAWKQAPESILDPRNPGASNSFTSTSYLGLAYVRLQSTYDAKRRLRDWDPKTTGASLLAAPPPRRSQKMESALLHAAQAFAIPVKFGIEYLGRKQFHHWDTQNFVWHLEAAIFLSKWFQSVAQTCHSNALTDFEARLINVVNNLVKKGEESIDPDLPYGLGRDEGEAVSVIASSLSRRVARLWACLYYRQNSPWGLVDVIGRSLSEYDGLIAQA